VLALLWLLRPGIVRAGVATPCCAIAATAGRSASSPAWYAATTRRQAAHCRWISFGVPHNDLAGVAGPARASHGRDLDLHLPDVVAHGPDERVGAARQLGR
jgi:hypothetical protein